MVNRAFAQSGMALLLATRAVCASAASGADNFSYPELSVVPHASDRIEMEAAKEEPHRWTGLLQVDVPALTLFTAAVVQAIPGNIDPSTDPSRTSPWIGGVVGGGWLAYGILSQLWDNTYAAAANDLKAMPKGTTREQLTRERFAEEILQRKARQMRLIRFASAITIAGTAIYMSGNATGQVTGGPYALNSTGISKVMDYAAAATALIPMIFPTYYEDVAAQQMEYKKRIYAPVAQAAFFGSSAGAAPGVSLTWKF